MTTLYEERKRNEAPRRKLMGGFPPLAKPTGGGKPKFDLRTVVLDSRGRCHRSVLYPRTQRLSWILVFNTCRRVHSISIYRTYARTVFYSKWQASKRARSII